jgi:hypothetical protein
MKKIICSLFLGFVIILSACLPSNFAPERTDGLSSSTSSTQNLITTTPTILLKNTLTGTPYPTATPFSTQIPSSTLSQTQQSTSLSVLYFYDANISFYGYIPVGLGSKLDAIRLGYDDVVFTHFSDKLLHFTWDEPPQMWISDLDLQNNLRISGDSLPPCSSSWYWSPDDLHLICEAEDGSNPGSIYDLVTGVWEPWEYACDRIAVSPKTGHLSTWCKSIKTPNSYQVMEWGGEIWSSTESPTSTLVQTNPRIPYSEWLWGWSADGQKIAYFDSEGYLTIASAQGTLLRTLPGARDSLTTDDQNKLWESRIQFTADGSKILVLARGSINKPCPSLSTVENPACWQVIDAQTGEVIWHLADFIDQYSDYQSDYFSDASISADGQYLALTSWNLNGSHTIIDIYSQPRLLQFFPANLFATPMRWRGSSRD